MRLRIEASDGLLVAGIALAILVRAFPDNAIDLQLSLAMQRLTSAEEWLTAASWLGDSPADLAVPVVAVALLLVLGEWLEAGWLLASLAGGWLIVRAIHVLVARPRPGPPVHALAAATGTSFPSSHVVSYVALLGFVLVIVRARVPPIAARVLGELVLVVLLVSVGPSRVYLGVHWTSDVIGGYLFGGWWLSVVRRGYLATRIRWPARTEPDDDQRSFPDSAASRS